MVSWFEQEREAQMVLVVSPACSEREDTHADRRFEFFSSLALDWPTFCRALLLHSSRLHLSTYIYTRGCSALPPTGVGLAEYPAMRDIGKVERS